MIFYTVLLRIDDLFAVIKGELKRKRFYQSFRLNEFDHATK